MIESHDNDGGDSVAPSAKEITVKEDALSSQTELEVPSDGDEPSIASEKQLPPLIADEVTTAGEPTKAEAASPKETKKG